MSDAPHTLRLRHGHITLAQALKASGLAATGGQARHLVREGQAAVNGRAENRPGRKLVAGDRFGLAGRSEWTVVGAE
jgi:ribosome-associated protein